jgi:lysophospholipase L1-like esterase
LPDNRAPTYGVLAFGDSITNGGGELQWGVAMQSWALWLARAAGLPFTNYAVDGATAPDVVHSQVPAFQAVNAKADARYDLGCLYIGVNDVRGLDWNAGRFAEDHLAAVKFLQERCDRVLTLTAPLDLGRPRAGSKLSELNATIRRNAAATGALVAELEDFGARNLVMTDHVHPTALGQAAIAERAMAVLAAAGMAFPIAPGRLVSFETTWLGRLRGDLTYLYRHLKVSARSTAIFVRLWLKK